MARLAIVAWNEPGRCDTDAMTRAIEAHVLRHDTYASRFVSKADHTIERRTIADPTQIRFEPVTRGDMAWDDWRRSLLDTPGPLDWNCFGFHVVQYADYFTFCLCTDHLNADGSLTFVAYADIHDTYDALVAGRPLPVRGPSASHLDYCKRQAARVDALSVESAEVRQWVEYLQPADPTAMAPLPLGRVSATSTNALVRYPLMDAATTNAFQQACVTAGSRLLGGVLAVVAKAWTELSSSSTFRAITPTTSFADHGGREYLGWFTGVVPLVFGVTGRTLEQLMASAQETFDHGRHLSAIPPEAVCELTGIGGTALEADWSAPMISLADFTRATFYADILAQWQSQDGRALLNDGSARQVALWVNRDESGASLTASFPDTTAARHTLQRLTERITELAHDVAGRERR